MATTATAADQPGSSTTIDAATGIIIAPRVVSTTAKEVAVQIETTDAATGIIIAPRIVPSAAREVAVQIEANDDDAPAKEGLPTIVPSPKKTSKYRAAFNSIPFSRAEYDANPSYRHDAAMEILTGNPRPQKTIIQAPAQRKSAEEYPRVMRQYFDMSRGPYSGYQHLFGYEDGYRPMYYRY